APDPPFPFSAAVADGIASSPARRHARGAPAQPYRRRADPDVPHALISRGEHHGLPRLPRAESGRLEVLQSLRNAPRRDVGAGVLAAARLRACVFNAPAAVRAAGVFTAAPRVRTARLRAAPAAIRATGLFATAAAVGTAGLF